MSPLYHDAVQSSRQAQKSEEMGAAPRDLKYSLPPRPRNDHEKAILESRMKQYIDKSTEQGVLRVSHSQNSFMAPQEVDRHHGKEKVYEVGGQIPTSRKLKSPRKGPKGALGWLMKPFAKDPIIPQDLSVPESRLSKQSFKSMDSKEYLKADDSLPTMTSPSAENGFRKLRRTVNRRRFYEDTPESQQRRWLLHVHRAIRDSALKEVMMRTEINASKEQSKPEPPQPKKPVDENIMSPTYQQPQRNRSSSDSDILDGSSSRHVRSGNVHTDIIMPLRSTRRTTRDYGAHSTFDDEQSVSSIELLFNWLTCRNGSFEEKRRRHDFQPEGMEFDIRSNSSDPYVPKQSTGLCH